MSNTTKSTNVKSIVATAFFAAVIFLGIQSFRIPLPAAAGTPFVHFGHIFVMLAILCLGARRSCIAGVLGLVIFDLLNGYIHSIPNVLVSTIILCMLVGIVFWFLKRKAGDDRKREYKYAVFCTILYGIVNIVIDFAWSVAELVILGSSMGAAIIAELASIPATIINAVFTVIGIAILYLPVVTAYRKILK